MRLKNILNKKRDKKNVIFKIFDFAILLVAFCHFFWRHTFWSLSGYRYAYISSIIFTDLFPRCSVISKGGKVKWCEYICVAVVWVIHTDRFKFGNFFCLFDFSCQRVFCKIECAIFFLYRRVLIYSCMSSYEKFGIEIFSVWLLVLLTQAINHCHLFWCNFC